MKEIFEISFGDNKDYDSEFIDFEGTRKGVVEKVKELIKTERFKGREGFVRCVEEPGEPSEDIVCFIRKNGTINIW